MARPKKATHRATVGNSRITRHHKITRPAKLGDWLSRLPARDWFDFATQQRTRLAREVNHLSNEILNRIRESHIFSNRDEVLKEAKEHLDSILSHINNSELISRVIDAARGTRNEILSFLNIPSSKELSSLQKRLNLLEKKLSSVRPRARA